MSTAVLTKIKEPVQITERELITKLKGFAYERQRAIGYYPNATGANEKLEAIDEVLLRLDKAENCLNTTQAIRLALSVASSMHFIAPHATRKLHYTWYTKVEQLMNGCREYLGRVKE